MPIPTPKLRGVPAASGFAGPKVNAGKGFGGVSIPSFPKQASFAAPPKPAKAKPVAPSVNSTAPHPNTGVSNKGAINPNAYGLRTTGAAAKQPYNPLAQPKTVGDFNSEVNLAAEPGYQPQLAQNAADVSSENNLTAQRTQDINSVYSQYQQQAQAAFQETQKALQDMIAQEHGGDAASQAYLSSALQAGQSSPNTLATMMGMTTPPSQAGAAVAPYLAASAGLAGNTELGQAVGGQGELANMGQAVTGASMEKTAQDMTELNRHSGQLTSLTGARNTIIQGIPALVEKAREQLQTDLLAAQSQGSQEKLANEQEAQSALTNKANIYNANQTLLMNEGKTNADIANAKRTLDQNQETIGLNAQKVKQGWVQISNQASQFQTTSQIQAQQVANAASASRAKLAQALANAQGKQQANAIKFLQGWASPTKTEMTPAHKDPTTGQEVPAQVNVKNWHRDAGNALKTLMNTYGLNLTQSLNLMSTLTTPIGGQWNQTVGQWASSYVQRLQQRNQMNKVTPEGNKVLKTVEQNPLAGIG